MPSVVCLQCGGDLFAVSLHPDWCACPVCARSYHAAALGEHDHRHCLADGCRYEWLGEPSPLIVAGERGT